jgi:hypothetical protein
MGKMKNNFTLKKMNKILKGVEHLTGDYSVYIDKDDKERIKLAKELGYKPKTKLGDNKD